MSEDYFYNRKRIDDLEEGKITAIDRLKGRVSLYLRNGLVSTGTYLFDIKNLRVGMGVLVGRVSNSYVIINEVKGIPKEAEASCRAKTNTITDWSAFYAASGATGVRRASMIDGKIVAEGNNGEELYTEDETGQSGWNSMCGGATIGDVPSYPVVNESYELAIVPGSTPAFGPLYMVKVSGEGTFVPNTYTPRIPSSGCTGQDVIELRTSLEVQTIPEEGDPPVDHTEDDDYRVCQTLNSDVDVTATCGGATIGYTGSLSMQPGDTKSFTIVGAGEHVGTLALSLEPGSQGTLVNGVYTAAVAGQYCMGYATIKLKSSSSDSCYTICDSVSITVDGQPKGNGATIGFTTQQMSVGESQTLTIIEGETPPYGTLRFNLWSGGGSFSENTYTAAAENPGCVNNAGIQLLCEIEGCTTEICDTLSIAVTMTSVPAEKAYYNYEEKRCTWRCELRRKSYRCDGTYGDSAPIWDSWVDCAGSCSDVSECTDPNCELRVVDTRTETQLLAGCCPAALL